MEKWNSYHIKHVMWNMIFFSFSLCKKEKLANFRFRNFSYPLKHFLFCPPPLPPSLLWHNFVIFMRNWLETMLKIIIKKINDKNKKKSTHNPLYIKSSNLPLVKFYEENHKKIHEVNIKRDTFFLLYSRDEVKKNSQEQEGWQCLGGLYMKKGFFLYNDTTKRAEKEAKKGEENSRIVKSKIYNIKHILSSNLIEI